MSGGVWTLAPNSRGHKEPHWPALSPPHPNHRRCPTTVSSTWALALALITQLDGSSTHPPPKPWNAHSWLFLHTVKAQKTDEGRMTNQPPLSRGRN